jgi:fagellar hook-basal body proteins
MVRALWTASTGMISQQTNVDTISNNLANMNTTGYKKESAEFKSLLYQTIQEQSYNKNGTPKPSGIQLGLGVRNSAITSQYTQGAVVETKNDFDLAIDGNGFFMVKTQNGDIAYTRNGNFQMVIGSQGITLADSEGNPVLDTNLEPIVVDSSYNTSDLIIDKNGELYYKVVEDNTDANADTNTDTNPDTVDKPLTRTVSKPLGIQIGIAQYNNPSGLEKLSDSLLQETDASGGPLLEATDNSLTKSIIKQGFLEGSNVQAVDEMVNLIVAQRAYEMNSKIITAADQMLQQANNLRS